MARDLSEIRGVLTELQASNERLRQEVTERKRAEKELASIAITLRIWFRSAPMNWPKPTSSSPVK